MNLQSLCRSGLCLNVVSRLDGDEGSERFVLVGWLGTASRMDCGGHGFWVACCGCMVGWWVLRWICAATSRLPRNVLLGINFVSIVHFVSFLFVVLSCQYQFLFLSPSVCLSVSLCTPPPSRGLITPLFTSSPPPPRTTAKNVSKLDASRRRDVVRTSSSQQHLTRRESVPRRLMHSTSQGVRSKESTRRRCGRVE